jgi:Sigma-70, non-essential region
MQHNEQLSPAHGRKYKKLNEEIVADVKSLRFNQARIDSLIDQLYDLNRRLLNCEGRLMQLAESHHVTRCHHRRQINQEPPIWNYRSCGLNFSALMR